MRAIHLYISIPFCRARCAFCDQVTFPAAADQMRQYTDALIREMEMTAPDFADCLVQSVTLGGGSPSLLASEQLSALMRNVRALFHVDPDAQITLETSPNRIRANDVVLFGNLGINRLALGIVTARTAEADYLGMRSSIGSAETAMILPQMFHLHSYESTILYGIPGQTKANFQTSLKFVVRYNSPEIVLRPLHITQALRNMHPEGTAGRNGRLYPDHDAGTAAGPGFRAREDEAWHPEDAAGGQADLAQSSDDEIAAMMAYAAEHLTQKGYHEYLPGCWAKPGHESTSRLGLESQEDYLSFGPGTVSRTDGIYYRTTANLQRYISHCTEPDMLYQVLQAGQDVMRTEP